MAAQDTAIRKRQQIANANRMMFLWVAGISVIVGLAAVGSVFLLQKAWFNEKILAEKSNTASVLTKNNETVDELKNQVRVLNTNQALKDVMLPNEDQPIQVVLDALPSEANSSAFGASLQEKFLNDGALTVESLTVDPVAGVESSTDETVQDASASASSDSNPNQITFRFAVSVDSNNVSALKSLLQRLERSVRAINLKTALIESQGSRVLLTVSGSAYYEPAKTVELKDKVVKP